MKYRYFFLFLSFSLIACQPSEEKLPTQLLFGHRGAGPDVYQNEFLENTLPAVKHALQFLDGCEIDIQLAADSTIWLYHDDKLGHFCNTADSNSFCIPKSSVSELEAIKQCREGVSDQLYRLETIFKELAKNEFSNKWLSLDVKGYFDERCFPDRNAPSSYFDPLAQQLVKLIRQYDLADRVIVETGYSYFLDQIKTHHPSVGCHLINYDDFPSALNKAIEKGYDGVSSSIMDSTLTKQLINEAQANQLAVQLWPIKNEELLKKAIKLNPFSMQISGLDLTSSSIRDIKRERGD